MKNEEKPNGEGKRMKDEGWRMNDLKTAVILHFAFFILPSSFFIHVAAPIPPPYCHHTAWLAAKRPSQLCEYRMPNAQ